MPAAWAMGPVRSAMEEECWEGVRGSQVGGMWGSRGNWSLSQHPYRTYFLGEDVRRGSPQ